MIYTFTNKKNLKDKRYLVLHMMTQYFLKQMKILYKDAFFDNEYLKKIYSSYLKVIFDFARKVLEKIRLMTKIKMMTQIDRKH